MKRIFQYTDPKDTKDDTRWIAASTEEAADAEAQRRGWVRRGYDGEIFTCSTSVRRHWKTAKDYKQAGCDVVLA